MLIFLLIQLHQVLLQFAVRKKQESEKSLLNQIKLFGGVQYYNSLLSAVLFLQRGLELFALRHFDCFRSV